jgi:prevent-host-death family protein
MTSIPLRELRNDASAVLRRVEAGERLTVTIDGRPVADLVPHPQRRQWRAESPIPPCAPIFAERSQTRPTMSELGGVLDTNILIGLEAGTLAGDALPERAAISVMTLAELQVGVLLAGSTEQRSRRLETLTFVERTYEPLPVTAEVARRFSEIVAALRSDGRRAPVIDALIAATAVEHGVPVVTRDADMAALPGVDVLWV